MDENTQVDIEEAAPTAAPEETPAPSQEETAVQDELDRIENGKRTKKEKLLYTKERIEKQLAELGGTDDLEDENRPLTLKDLRALEAVRAQETAKNLADEIGDEAERKLVLHHLEHTIKPSGDAQTDLRNARLIVNSVKNGMIAEDAARAATVRRSSSAPAAPPKTADGKLELSKEDAAVMRGFKMTEEQVRAALGR
jgi:hypothetical protein